MIGVPGAIFTTLVYLWLWLTLPWRRANRRLRGLGLVWVLVGLLVGLITGWSAIL